jgi:hypothetical protein
MKKLDRIALIILLVASILCAIAGLLGTLALHHYAAKWLASSGLLLTMAGVVQLEVSGLFQDVMDHYNNEEIYPFGPPSYIAREIVDDPDSPTITWLRNSLFIHFRTGFWLIIIGTSVQIFAVWL